MEIEKIIEQVTREIMGTLATQQTVPGGACGRSDLASHIEHSVMNPDTTKSQVEKACTEARTYRFANVCVSPYFVPYAIACLKGSGVKVCTAIGFPHGAASTTSKIAEAREAIQNGAEELDISLNILAIKSGDLEEAKRDFQAVSAVATGKAKVKAIYEQSLFSDEEKVKVLTLIKMIGPDFVKISNALSGKKASVEDVRFVRSIAGPGIGIKIDGGIADATTAQQLLDAGAARLGCSKSVQIVGGGAADYGDFKYTPGEKVRAYDIAKMIDHSLLRPDMTRQEVIDGCKLAREYDCATVCVKPCDVEIAAEILKGSDVLVTTVIGFPHGAHLTETKLKEAQIAIDQGCKELDLVQNIGRLKSGDLDLVEKDIHAVCELAHRYGVKVKVILENAYLTDEEKVTACRICERAGADWVKTSTGYAKTGATIHDLRLMRRTCSPRVQVKAAGGVRTLEGALAVRAVGGTRFGCTATKKIVEDARALEAQGKLVLPSQINELGATPSSPAPAKTDAATTSACTNCGNCTSTCPAGLVNITKEQPY